MMQSSSYFNPKPYIPASLSEINDQLGSMVLSAPTFKDRANQFPDWDINTEFDKLIKGFDSVRKKLGEERYARLIDLASGAKELFAADQDDNNGKTDQGRALLFEMEDALSDVRRSRVKAQQPDRDGEITGD